MQAVDTLRTINRRILGRLLAVWLLVALVATGLGYWIEVGKFESGLQALVSGQLQSLSRGLNREAPPESGTLAARTREFIDRNYLLIRVFDAQGAVIGEVDNPARRDLARQLQAQIRPWTPAGGRRFERLCVEGETVIRIMISLPATELGRVRALEGIFVLDSQQIEAQQAKLWRFLGAIVLVTLLTAMVLYPVILALNRELLGASRELLQGNVETAAVLGAAIAKRDSDTGEHNFRVTLYAIALAEQLALAPERIRPLILGAFLHDVGKIGIPDAILLKPGRLDDTEFSAMKAHVGLGLEIIGDSHWLAPAAEVIGNHHEKFDGSGYPQGRRGEDIPLNARIFAIVDVFDALMSVRPYKPPMPLAQALAILSEGRGRHFDGTLLDAFLGIAEDTHRKVDGLSEQALKQMLIDQLPRYFLPAAAH